MDELSNIRAFIDVVEAGSFSAASRKQGLSVSTVARQVKALEDELSVRLLHRNTRNHSLTQAGEMFYRRVSSLSRELNAAKLEASAHNDGLSGRIRVSLRNPVATTLIIPALEKFLDQHPEITLDVIISDERKDLIAHEIDVALWLGLQEDSEFVVRQLVPSQRILCASPRYFEKHGVPEEPADLANHNCLLFRRQSYDDVWYFTKDEVEQQIQVKGNFQTDDGLALMNAAICNLGLIMINERTAKKHLRSGELVRIFEDYDARPIRSLAPLYVVYPSRHGLSRKVRVFVDFLVRIFAEGRN